MRTSTAAAFALGFAAAVAVFSSGARADTVYTCSGGATMTYDDSTHEMRVRLRGSKIDVSIPFAGAASRFATWSPRGMDGVGERVAPFAEEWQPAVGDREIIFNIGDGEHTCKEAH